MNGSVLAGDLPQTARLGQEIVAVGRRGLVAIGVHNHVIGAMVVLRGVHRSRLPLQDFEVQVYRNVRRTGVGDDADTHHVSSTDPLVLSVRGGAVVHVGQVQVLRHEAIPVVDGNSSICVTRARS